MELTKAIAKLEADKNISDADKKAQIEKLEAEKTAYEQKLKSTQS